MQGEKNAHIPHRFLVVMPFLCTLHYVFKFWDNQCIIFHTLLETHQHTRGALHNSDNGLAETPFKLPTLATFHILALVMDCFTVRLYLGYGKLQLHLGQQGKNSLVIEKSEMASTSNIILWYMSS